MPTEDTIIVDFDSLNEAMGSFCRVSGFIDTLASSLATVSSVIDSIWKSGASRAYVAKLALLKRNFDTAKANLDKEGLELKRLYLLEYEAEQSAVSIAASIAEFVME